MSNVGRLLGARARTDRWLLPIWIAGIGALGLAASSAVGSQFADEAQRASIVAIAAASPAFLFLRGLPDGLSVGSVVFFQAFSFTAVLAGLMSTFLVVRHTRTEEELGRAELVGSTPVRRTTPLAATVTLGVLANAALTLIVALGYVLGGLPPKGALVAALAVGSVGIVFVAVAAIAAQLLPSGRAANGVAAAIVGAAYLVRGIGDALGTPNAALTEVSPAWVSWLSPIGWGQATRPFTDATVVPLLVPLGVFSMLTLAALDLQARRDLGSSLLHDRGGPEKAGMGGRSVLGLAWRLQRSTLVGWCIGGAVLGLIAGGLAPVVADAVEGNPSLGDVISGLVPVSNADIVDIFAAALIGIAGVLAAAAGVQAVLRLRAEESEGRAELLLATPASRGRWIVAAITVAAVSVLAVCVVTGVAVGGALRATSGDASALERFTAAGLAHVPAALVFVALAALAFAGVPKRATPIGWGILVAGLILGQFGDLLRLPNWLQNVSPFRHSSALPIEDLNLASTLILIGVAGTIAVLAAFLFRRRDLVP